MVPTADAAATREGRGCGSVSSPGRAGGGEASQEETTVRQMHAAVAGALKGRFPHSESTSGTEQGSRGSKNTAPREAGVLSLQGGSLATRPPVHSLSGARGLREHTDKADKLRFPGIGPSFWAWGCL